MELSKRDIINLVKEAPQLHIAHPEVLDSVQEWANKQGVGVYIFFDKPRWAQFGLPKRNKEE